MKLNDFPEILFATSKISDGNMSFLRGDPKDAFENRKKFLKLFNIDLNSTVSISPIHGNKILKVGKTDLGKGAFNVDNAPKVDGLITNERGVFLFLLTADCLPISIYDPKNKAIGLIHAGRVGLRKKILKIAIKTMLTSFKSDPKKLLVKIGPSIGPCCYKKVLPEKSISKLKPYVAKQTKDEYIIDIWSWSIDQLKEAGLLMKNIDNPKICTYHNKKYFSHRQADDEKLSNDYRFATVLGLK